MLPRTPVFALSPHVYNQFIAALIRCFCSRILVQCFPTDKTRVRRIGNFVIGDMVDRSKQSLRDAMTV